MASVTSYTKTALDAALEGKSSTSHNHDTRYVRTVNGTGPDGAGDVAVAGGGAVAPSPVTVGRWAYWTDGAPFRGTEALTLGKTYWMGHHFAEPTSIDRIAARVHAAFTAGTTDNVSVYDDTGQIYPDQRLADLGALDLTTTGDKSLTCALTLSGWVWIRFACSPGETGTGRVLGSQPQRLLSTDSMMFDDPGAMLSGSYRLVMESPYVATPPVTAPSSGITPTPQGTSFPYFAWRAA